MTGKGLENWTCGQKADGSIFSIRSKIIRLKKNVMTAFSLRFTNYFQSSSIGGNFRKRRNLEDEVEPVFYSEFREINEY